MNCFRPARATVLEECRGGLACADGLPGDWPLRFGAADDEVAPAEWCFSGGILCGTGAIALVAGSVLAAGGG